ncbi:hypothetical protein CTB91_02084 [Dickeya solani]|nr:hypothetical protein CTB91_02084 [Dickeya solani]AYQ52058.1 hypothetical protein DSOL99_02089 [Dickeya solani]NUA52061.1 hypothetical protein [Dickeya solani]QKO05422.1 hypothetical protein HAT87_02089 [Dickeya solani]QKO09568.1 hypothetical protein HAT89_02089 [Dickeya solani]
MARCVRVFAVNLFTRKGRGAGMVLLCVEVFYRAFFILIYC